MPKVRPPHSLPRLDPSLTICSLAHPQELVAEHTRAIPLQTYGSIDDIAQAATFLFSPGAKYITAATLVVDGGSVRPSSFLFPSRGRH